MMSNNRFRRAHKGITPIIATLLLVAIAVVGGVTVLTFSQGIFNDSSVQSSTIDALEILGYDARDNGAQGVPNCGSSVHLAIHNGVCTYYATGSPNSKLGDGDAITLFLKNKGSKPVSISEVVFNGKSYTHDTSSGYLRLADNRPAQGKFALVQENEVNSIMSNTGSNIINAGETKTLMIRFDNDNVGDIKIGKDISIKIVTGNGAAFSYTINNGTVRGL